MEISRFGPHDTDQLAGYVATVNAARAVDSPWVHPLTLREKEGDLRHGWDGEPSTPYLGTEDGAVVAVGAINTSELDNLHLAWLNVQVHPDHRRRGLGSEMLAAMVGVAAERGRTSVGSDGWAGDGPAAFAARHGFEAKSVAVNRRQFLAEVDWALLDKLHDEAATAASAYDVVRRVGATPDDELEAVAAMTAAINDAPKDGLDIEDEVFTPERVGKYEAAQLGRGFALHRVLAGNRLAEQHDTSVVAGHRGHRLGLLLKTEMNLWLRDAQPQIESIDTWNAESNDHMIGVNEAIGYRVMGREVEYQRAL